MDRCLPDHCRCRGFWFLDPRLYRDAIRFCKRLDMTQIGAQDIDFPLVRCINKDINIFGRGNVHLSTYIANSTDNIHKYLHFRQCRLIPDKIGSLRKRCPHYAAFGPRNLLPDLLGDKRHKGVKKF